MLTVKKIWDTEFKELGIPDQGILAKAGSLAITKFFDLGGEREHLEVRRGSKEYYLDKNGTRKRLICAQTVYPKGGIYKASRIKALLVWAIKESLGVSSLPPSSIKRRKRI